MKKSVLLLAALMFTATFSSCLKDKEGEFQPKEKISRIYHDYGYGDGKSLSERWIWDEKQLKSIDHYDEGELDFTEEFTYNKKGQIERVDCYLYGESMEYKYDDKDKLSKITYYEGSSIEFELSFTHDGNHVSKIEYMEFSKGKNYNCLMAKGFNPLNLILPQEPAEKIKSAVMKKPADSKSDMATIELAWEKDNVKDIKMYIGTYKYTYTMEYDSYLNPYTGFYNSFYFVENLIYPEDYGYSGGFFSYSKNNITNMKYDEDGDIETYRYSYTYNDNKYPSVKRYTYTYEEFNYETYEWEELTRTKSTYYEYE